jgi:hypothetical protein
MRLQIKADRNRSMRKVLQEFFCKGLRIDFLEITLWKAKRITAREKLEIR